MIEGECLKVSADATHDAPPGRGGGGKICVESAVGCRRVHGECNIEEPWERRFGSPTSSPGILGRDALP